jgi:hypothetical protein
MRSIVNASRASSGAEAIELRALRLIAVLGSEAHVDVLTGVVPRPPRHLEHDRPGPRGLVDHTNHPRTTPHDRHPTHPSIGQARILPTRQSEA